MSLAIYRKYRPKNFEEVLGQQSVAEILKNAGRQDKLAHAYLFYGPRGTGKTTTARLLAKIANCETRIKDKKFKEKGEPCNKCGRCEDIDAGRALDVIEIDAASNRGIDEMRNLKENIRLSPTSYPYKIFIIDEAHMLTRDAFPALLKTLEEPPVNTIIILATTEYEKIPPTISSRAQRFHFKKLSVESIAQKLNRVVKEEKMKISEEAIELIAASADGSARDAESLLDQLTSLEEKVEVENVEKIIGKVGFTRTSEFSNLVLESNLSEALAYITKLDKGGYNLVDFTKELIHYWRRILSLKFDPKLEELFQHELTKKELEQIKSQGEKILPDKHLLFIKSLIRAYGEMRYSPFAIVPLEIAIIENLKK